MTLEYIFNNLYLKDGKIGDLFDRYLVFSTTDTKGKITYASKLFSDICGYSQEELVGSPHNIVRHQDMPAAVYKEMWEKIQNDQVWEGEIKNLKKDGGFYWIDVHIEPLYDADGKKVGYFALYYDITQQKETESLQEELRKTNQFLEHEVERRIQDILKLNQEIRDTQYEIIFTMGTIGELRSKETGNHVKRVAEYSKLLALYIGMDKFHAELLKEASPMHDIGKIGIPDTILNKPGRHTQEEMEIMRTHVTLGYEMLRHSDKELLQISATIAHEHHEKWDGSGYPRGLKGEQINIYARITAVADVFDALGSDRVYKKAWKDEDIWAFLKEQRGKHFDPLLVDVFLNNIEDFKAIRNRFRDIV